MTTASDGNGCVLTAEAAAPPGVKTNEAHGGQYPQRPADRPCRGMRGDVGSACRRIWFDKCSRLQTSRHHCQRRGVDCNAQPRRERGEPLANRRAANQKQSKRQPPDEIVVNAQHAEPPRPVVAERRDHADRAEHFAQQADGDDRPGCFQLPGGVPIQQAVDANDHSDARPDAGIAWRRDFEELERTPAARRLPTGRTPGCNNRPART